MRTCAAEYDHEKCGNPYYARGYCSIHYKQFKKGGEFTRPKIRNKGFSCSYKGCERGTHSKRYCSGHYQQVKAGLEPSELESRTPGIQRDSEGRKTCRTCREPKQGKEFPKMSNNKDGLSIYCISCTREAYLNKKHKVTQEWVDNQLEIHGGCAACGTKETPRGKWHIDHDHACCEYGKKRNCGICTRGVLCSGCNLAIGHARDDPDILIKIAKYLTKFKGDNK